MGHLKQDTRGQDTLGRIFTREVSLATFRLLFCTPSPFRKGVYFKGKNLLLGGEGRDLGEGVNSSI